MSNWFQSRQARAGGYSGAYVLVFIGILAAVNYLAVQHNKSFDATEEKLYSLSDQTLKLLADLPGEATIYYFDRKSAFDQPSPEGVSPRASLTRYENASTAVAVEYVDPDSDPARAEMMRVRSFGTVLVELAGVREEAGSPSEQDVTNAMIKLIKGEEKTVCILSGHGESSVGDFQAMGFSIAEEALQDANYTTRDFSLLENPTVPEVCDAVLVAGPSDPLLEPEIEILRSFVERGGRLLAMLDLGKSPGLAAMLSEWGVRVDDNLVLDRSSVGILLGGGPVIPVAGSYEAHPITDPLSSASRPTLFPLVRSVESQEAPTGWTLQGLVSTSESSEAVEDYENEEALNAADGAAPGPFNVAVAGSLTIDSSPPAQPSKDQVASVDSDLEGRIVVVGTSRFARNSYLGRSANLDLFLNMVNWLTSDEDLISIRPKSPASTPIELTESESIRIFLGLVVGLPLVIVIAGIRTWWVRR